MRGQIFELCGRMIFIFGGASSHDISGGILKLDEGRENLLKHDNTVDFIVSHCAVSSTAALLGQGLYKPDILTDYFEEICQNVKFQKWVFGHYHDNRNVNAEEILLWEQIIRIA